MRMLHVLVFFSALAVVGSAPCGSTSEGPVCSADSRNLEQQCSRVCLKNSYFLFGTVGVGANCEDARNDLSSQLYSIANARCAARYPTTGGMVCFLSEDYPKPCTEVVPGQFQVPGNAIYTCSALLFC